MKKEKKPTVDISNLPRPAILELTQKLVGIATRQLASGKDVSQENIAIVNRARKALTKARK